MFATVQQSATCVYHESNESSQNPSILLFKIHFCHHKTVCIFLHSCPCYMPNPPHPPSFDHLTIYQGHSYITFTKTWKGWSDCQIVSKRKKERKTDRQKERQKSTNLCNISYTLMLCKQTLSELQMELEGLPLTISIQLPSRRIAQSVQWRTFSTIIAYSL